MSIFDESEADESALDEFQEALVAAGWHGDGIHEDSWESLGLLENVGVEGGTFIGLLVDELGIDVNEAIEAAHRGDDFSVLLDEYIDQYEDPEGYGGEW